MRTALMSRGDPDFSGLDQSWVVHDAGLEVSVKLRGLGSRDYNAQDLVWVGG